MVLAAVKPAANAKKPEATDANYTNAPPNFYLGVVVVTLSKWDPIAGYILNLVGFNSPRITPKLKRGKNNSQIGIVMSNNVKEIVQINPVRAVAQFLRLYCENCDHQNLCFK